MSNDNNNKKANDTSSSSKSHSLRLLLHCENGFPPYLTPNLLSKYFHPTKNELVKEHLTLGVQIRDSFVVPTFHQKKKKDKKTKNNPTKKQNGHDRIKPPQSSINTENDKTDTQKADLVKPTGYTFSTTCTPPSLGTSAEGTTSTIQSRQRTFQDHFNIPSEYQIVTVPVFDFLSSNKSSKQPSTKEVLANTTNDKLVSLNTSHGYQKLSPLTYANLIHDITMSDDSTQQISHVGLYDQFLPDITTKTSPTTDASVIEKVSLKDKKKYHVTLNRTQKWQNEYLHHISTKSSSSCLSMTKRIQMWLPIVATPSSHYIHENTNHHNHSTIIFESQLQPLISRDSIIQYNGISLVGLHHLSNQNDKSEKDQIQRFLKTLQQTLKSIVPSSSSSSSQYVPTKIMVLKASSLTEIMNIAFSFYSLDESNKNNNNSDTSIQLEMIGSDLPQVLARQGKALNLNMKKWRQIVKARIENREKSEMNNINNNEDSEMIANGTDQGIDTTENDHRNNSPKRKKQRLLKTINNNERIDSNSDRDEPIILDLTDIKYVKDTKPIISDGECSSLACGGNVDINEESDGNNGRPHVSFMRAYIHHLIKVNEMLSQILLFCHNLHQMLEFFHELSLLLEMLAHENSNSCGSECDDDLFKRKLREDFIKMFSDDQD